MFYHYERAERTERAIGFLSLLCKAMPEAPIATKKNFNESSNHNQNLHYKWTLWGPSLAKLIFFTQPVLQVDTPGSWSGQAHFLY